MRVRTRNHSDVASERNLKKSIAILRRNQYSILFHGGLIRFRFALTASTPMNIDTARKDIKHRNQRVKRQAYLGSEEGQSNRNDVDEWRHQRPVHRTADQASIDVRLDVAAFGGGVPPMERQRQTDCDQVGSIDCDRKPSFRVFTK